jgi:hypothetical protein
VKLFYDLVRRSRRSRRLERWPQAQCFAAILRDAVLCTAPQDEVRGIKLHTDPLAFCGCTALPRGEPPEQCSARRFACGGFASDNVSLLIEHHQYPFEPGRQRLGQVVSFRLDEAVTDARTMVRSLPVASMPHFPHLASRPARNGNAVLPRSVPADPSKFPPGTAIPDNVPPGDVTVRPTSPQLLRDAIIEKGPFQNEI